MPAKTRAKRSATRRRAQPSPPSSPKIKHEDHLSEDTNFTHEENLCEDTDSKNEENQEDHSEMPERERDPTPWSKQNPPSLENDDKTIED